MKKIVILCLVFFQIQAAGDTMNKNAKIYVAGHQGLVGSALVRKLQADGYTNIITRAHKELDLRDQRAVQEFFEKERPEYVFLAAAKVGGIKANMDYPAQFIFDNLAIEINVIDSAYRYGVKKLLFLGSSCIYPRNCPQPMKEEYLLTSELESSNEMYAIAKIAGLKMCQAYNRQYGTKFISCMPTNLYGPNDNFDLNACHVVPALLRKFYTAKKNRDAQVVVWGTGNAFREFLYADDLADACVFLMNAYDGNDIINVGTGQDITVGDVARMIKNIVGYEGELIFDITKPDGTPKKLLNVEKLTKLGWHAQTSLDVGIQKTISWCIENTIF